MSFELAGNTLRDSSNTCAAISGGSSSSTISLPSSSTVEAAFLYWSGSGNTDSTVTFNNQTVTADVNYLETFRFSQQTGSNNYFSSKADVTNLVSNNTSTTYTVSDLNFDGSNTYCSYEGAYAGWAMVVIYENASEPLRVINIFDGFRSFWGDDFDLTPNNFVIASNPSTKGGKHAHITWEGDSGNSEARSGHNESLSFEGNDLTNPDVNPSGNQFNGYSNIQGNTSGVDIDEYEIGSYLTAGDTSVTTNYSSGQDAVFLTAEIISVPNEPVAELSIEQSGPDNLVSGVNNTITFTVTNNGPNTELANSEFNLTIPDGLTYVSSSNPLWNCSVTGSELTCIYSNTILKDNTASLPLIFTLDNTLENGDNVNVSGTITGVLFDNVLSNNTALESYTVQRPSLITSTKEAIDLNGGNVESGDTIRYTITISESSGIAVDDVSLTDHLSAQFSEFEIVSLPTGAIDNSLASPAGDNNSGLIQIDNIDVAGSGNESIVIDATLLNGLASGTAIDNSATLTSPTTVSVTIDATTLYSSQAANSSSGNKHLYFNSDSSLSRTRPVNDDDYITVDDDGDETWTLTPNFQTDFEFNDGDISLNLCLQVDDRDDKNVRMQVELVHNSTVIADSSTFRVRLPSINDTPEQFSATMSFTQTPVISAGDTLELVITNFGGNNNNNNNRDIRVYSMIGSDYCYASIPAKTVINVDSITVTDSDTATEITEVNPGSNITLEALVSDPFGSFDITSADLSATDAAGNTVFSNLAMTVINDSNVATKTFSYDYTIPSDAEIGYWTFTVRAKEGEENTIDHSSSFSLLVKQDLPNINVEKTIEVYSDPVHGTNSAGNYSKAFPGAILTYTVTAENTGEGTAQDDSIWISDSVPANTYMLVTDYDGISGQGPIKDETANTTNGLTYQFVALDDDTDDIEFSNNGTDFNYSPTEDSEGLDKTITHFRINPKGIFQAPAAGENSTKFTIKFRVQLQ